MNRQQAPDENSATFLAVFGLLLAAGGFIVLSALVMPTILGLVLVVFGFAGFSALHYLIWGRWLSHRQRDDDDDSDRTLH